MWQAILAHYHDCEIYRKEKKVGDANAMQMTKSRFAVEKLGKLQYFSVSPQCFDIENARNSCCFFHESTIFHVKLDINNVASVAQSVGGVRRLWVGT